MRKSVALLITLFFLMSVLFILNTILNNYEKYSNKTKPVFIGENSLVIKTSLSILSKISDNVKTSDDLQKIFTTVPLSNKEGNFRIIYTLKPLFNKIDINALLNGKRINPYIENYIDNILNYYEIKDPILFKDLILDTIDPDTKEREAYSEIILQNPYFQNGKIYNFKHFKQIEDYYYQRTEDKNIYNIPWKKLIFFGNGGKHIIECNLMSKKVAMFLGLTVNNEVSCKSINDGENNKTIKNLNIIAYNKGESFWVENDIIYFLNNQKHDIKIIYDIKNKKVVSIESNPVY